jgi:hypothetical protein
MSNEDQQDPERTMQEKIASQMHATAPKKPLTPEELRALQTAASRLDQLLKSAADADHQAMKTAATRLDQLLADIASGKDVSHALKRPRDRQHQEE